MAWLHPYGRLFMLLNGVVILVFSLSAMIWPLGHWALLGLEAPGPVMARVLAWYLCTFALVAFTAAADPERFVGLVAVVAVEKVGPAIGFGYHAVMTGSLGAGTVACADAVLATWVGAYALWLRRQTTT